MSELEVVGLSEEQEQEINLRLKYNLSLSN